MALTGTVHPPAGATALMAVLDDKVQGLGWFLMAPVMLGCVIMLVCALLVNNIRRRFPFYWWSPEKTGGFWSGKKGEGQGEGVSEKEGEKGVGKAGSSSESGGGLERGARSDERLREGDGEGDVDIEAQSGGTLTESGDDDDDDDGEDSEGRIRKKKKQDGGLRVVIMRGGVEIPEGLNLRPEEIRFLETLAERL
ncbi:hypothetical protein SMACR_09220 [Sordaria macrospora]|uniref:HPP transmembrane region domain-containing protein n=2 Tax=Sordaria macrospora TaxID=5147 RepID=A0A8S8ZL02_SORMA|nr:hypothetical protein SMACR_09220 [Sordaria macrospora]